MASHEDTHPHHRSPRRERSRRAAPRSPAPPAATTTPPTRPSAAARSTQAKAAALADTPGKVTETEVGDEESYYEVEVTRPDGSQVDVQLDRDFNVVSSATDSENDDCVLPQWQGMPTREQITEALKSVIDPELRKDIVELEMVRAIDIKDGGVVDVTVSLTTPGLPDQGPLPDRGRPSP